MKTIIERLFRCFDSKNTEREIEDELRFHLELLTEEHLQAGITLPEAERAALKRFGNVELIKNQCVEISKRNQPLMRVLKSFLIIIFLTGVLTRIYSANIYGKQIADMLMLIGALGGLLLHIRGLSWSSFVSNDENSSPLGLSDIEQMPFAANSRKELSPIERVIADD